jgi:hypothetical protein
MVPLIHTGVKSPLTSIPSGYTTWTTWFAGGGGVWMQAPSRRHEKELDGLAVLEFEGQHISRQADARSDEVLVHPGGRRFAFFHDREARGEQPVDIEAVLGHLLA